jgi:hypothetical protein
LLFGGFFKQFVQLLFPKAAIPLLLSPSLLMGSPLQISQKLHLSFSIPFLAIVFSLDFDYIGFLLSFIPISLIPTLTGVVPRVNDCDLAI